MDDLHIRLPKGLKQQLKTHCRGANLSVTSAVIMMITNELREGRLAPAAKNTEGDDPFMGFFLRQ